MKKIIGAIALSAALAACGLVKTPIALADTNALGLRGQPVTVSLLDDGFVRSQATGKLNFVGTPFADSFDIKKYIDNLKGWVISQSFDGTAKVVLKAAGSCPATINLTGITLSVSLKSGTNTADAAVISNNPTLTLTRTGSSCDYTFNTAALIFSISYDEAAIATKVKPLLTDGASNTANGSLSFSSAELSAGDTITLTWFDGTSTITAGL